MENNEIPYFISLDYDLGCNQYNEENPSGYDACKWLANYLTNEELVEFHTVVCHSQNPISKENIEHYWNNFLKLKKI